MATKSQRILAFIILLTAGGTFIGYGATAMDFAFNNEVWSRDGSKTGDYVIGTFGTEEAFYIGAGSAMAGFIMIIAAINVGVINASTIKLTGYIVAGMILLGWAAWGFAFSFNTADYRSSHGIDTVGIPCPDPNATSCEVDYMDWYYINVGLAIAGFMTIVAAILRARFTTIHA